ncbi:hypothetical protein [Moraxella bovoculi]|uniref:Uncharacterized protein n=1 Tax=Moraxella bovoculi 237 TaxID=743974 RepID=A0A066UPR9_9GAMM|nr:hypothetical protein [Moraxella bovoculi]AKG14954.2 hypothetical protein AAX08_02030 [Moraxella bovoculi]KDN26134.1 hypothetical protein MBO_00150 [Moraxella bovoculi 237]
MRLLQEREEKLKETDRMRRDYVSPFEATFFMIGEYTIEKWNVEDSEGEGVPISGENLKVVASNIKEPMQFIQKLTDEFNACLEEFNKVANKTKKKPSTDTNGKSKKQS